MINEFKEGLRNELKKKYKIRKNISIKREIQKNKQLRNERLNKSNKNSVEKSLQ